MLLRRHSRLGALMADENDVAKQAEDVDAQVQQIPTEPMNVDDAVREPFWPSNAGM